MTSAETTQESLPLKQPFSVRQIPSWVYVALVAFAGLSVAFWPLFRYLPSIWFADDTYYAHGVVIPICSALMVWDRWPRIKDYPVKGVYWAALPIAIILYVLWFALRTEMHTFEALLLILLLGASALFVGGWRWLRALAVPIAYLAFALPMWDHLIDSYTLRTQMASTNFSVWILDKVGLHPYRQDTTTIVLDHFTLDVGVACSGMKLVLAVFAISVFFIIVARLRLWCNAILLVSILPLALIVNSLRIVLIAWVGNTWGGDAGHKFHDYSGYISLVICFLVLMKLTRILGWK